LLEAPAEASLGIFPSSAVAFHLMSSMVAKCVALRHTFRVGNSQTSPGARSRQYGDWVMTGQELPHNKRCEARGVTVTQKPLSLPLVAPLPPDCIAQPTISRCTKPSVSTKSANFLIAPLTYFYLLWKRGCHIGY
jgi:hypothetical protein